MNTILWVWSRILWNVFIWAGTKLFSHIDVYSPDKDIVIGVTFSNDKKYLEYLWEQRRDEKNN